MPQARLPPTPGSSLDITPKTQLLNIAPPLNLGPAAVGDGSSEGTASKTPSVAGSDSSYRPASPYSPGSKKRKQSEPQHSSSSHAPDGFTLPPPPARSRKIIQMNPQTNSVQQIEASRAPVSSTPAPQATASKPGRKRSSNTATTAAVRKMNRKTAHSLIERKRRTKMNEEFGVLKDMIPACKGHEMHKLAILQASIDYVRYLERCIGDLKSANGSSDHLQEAPPTSRHNDDVMDEDEDDAEDSDKAMSDHEAHQDTTARTSPATSVIQSSKNLPRLPSFSQLNAAPAPSPSLRAYSIASLSPYIPPSHTTSPVFGPSKGHSAASGSALPSPALRAQDQGPCSPLDDREAMAALLMLNTDRRARGSSSSWRDAKTSPTETVRSSASTGSSSKRDGGPMSVKGLLSM